MKDRYFAFVSYASANRAEAEDLVNALEARGLACWVAPRNIEASTDYGEQILQGIRDSTALVLVFSQHSNGSKFCQREVERGVHYGRRIFPVRIDNSLPSGPMEFHLSVVQWLDAQEDKDWTEIASQLVKSSERLSTQAPAGYSMPTAQGSKPYRFEDRDFRTVEELAVALSANWGNGVKNFGRGFVAEWVKGELKNYDLATQLLDLHEDRDLSPDEKLTLALAEMNGELPAFWRGNVVNREWAAREPEEFHELLTSKVRTKLEKKAGWPGELVERIERLRTLGLRPEEQVALSRVVSTGQPDLKLGAWDVKPETLRQRPEKAVALLEGRAPQTYEGLTGQKWLSEAAADWRKYWPQVEALGCGTAQDEALPWIIGDRDQLKARAAELLGLYVGSKLSAVQVLWERGAWGTAECVALCTTEEAQLLTKTEQSLREDLAWVKSLLGQSSPAEERQVEALLRQSDWKAIAGQLKEVRAPENQAVLEELPIWSELVGRAEWSYREGVALGAWIRGGQFQAAKAAHRKAQEEAAQARAVQRKRFVVTMAVALIAVAISLVLWKNKAASAARAKVESERLRSLAEKRLAWTGTAMRRAGFAEDRITRTLTQGGTVVAWGNNVDGQTTVPVGLTGVVSVAACNNQVVALKSDGTVVAWGNNHKGQSIVPTGLSGVVAVEAGWEHAVALKSDGTVVAWGSNDDGQSTVPAGLSGVVAIQAGSGHNLALKSDGTVVAWGQNEVKQSTVPSGLSGVVAIAAGDFDCVALKHDGTVVTWGASSRVGVGLLFEEDWDTKNTTTAAGGAVIKRVLAGGPAENSKQIKPGDRIIAIAQGPAKAVDVTNLPYTDVWRLLTGPHDTEVRVTIVPAGSNAAENRVFPLIRKDITGSAQLVGVTAIAAGWGHTAALKSDGTVVAWGRGLVNTGKEPFCGQDIVPAGLSGVVAVAAGGVHTVALKSDGTLVAWGAGKTITGKSPEFGQSIIPGGLSGVVAIAAGVYHTVALKLD